MNSIEDEIEKLRWQNATIDAYVPVPDDEEWLECPVCKRRPRKWVFDNGNYAKCQCSHKYAPAEVECEDVGTHYRKNGTVASYDCDGLRKAWNVHVRNMQRMKPEE